MDGQDPRGNQGLIRYVVSLMTLKMMMMMMMMMMIVLVIIIIIIIIISCCRYTLFCCKSIDYLYHILLLQKSELELFVSENHVEKSYNLEYQLNGCVVPPLTELSQVLDILEHVHTKLI